MMSTPKKESLRHNTALNKEILAKILANLCLATFCVDLNNGQMRVIVNNSRLQDFMASFDYEDYCAHAFHGKLSDHIDLLRKISLEKLREYAEQEKNEISFNFEISSIQDSILKLTLYFTNLKQGSYCYLVFTREQKSDILTAIAKRYIYDNCDYFIFLDGRRNSYVSFSVNKDSTTPPPFISDDYERDIVLYADTYVTQEERDHTIYEMMLARVTEQLDRKGSHVFYTSVKENGRISRKRLEYRYYNKQERMILLYRSDVTEIYDQNFHYAQELQAAVNRAYTDPLTTLLNYQGMTELATTNLKNNEYLSKALMFIDLDNFKAVNDTYGHLKGDEILKAVAEVLKSCTRDKDVKGRIGGDEFEVLLDDVKSHRATIEIGKRILEGIERIPYDHGIETELSCSIGIAFAPLDAKTFPDLVKVADDRVYEAKRLGKRTIIAM